MDFDGRSLKAQMTLADRLNATYVVILGDKELETGAAQVRPMRKLAAPGDGGRAPVEQEQVPFEGLVDYLSKKIQSEETR
jgi:histidyl-tRNA synthetase